MRLGVRQKLVLLSLLILVVVSFTFTAVQLDLTRTWREEDLRDRAVIFAREMAATIGDRHELESGALIDRKIHQIMAVRPSVLQLDIVRLPPDGGAVVATSEPAHRLPFTPADEVAVRGGAVLSRLLTDAGGRSWEVMAPIRLDGAVAGAVAARFSLNRFDAREARSRTIAFWLTAISVRVIGSQLGRLREIIDRLLDLTRRSPQPAVPVDVNGLVQETVELVRPAVAATRLELSVEADPGVPRLLAQRSELQQVVLNLLTNALDATPPGGAIRVATRARGDEVAVEVADTGCGIAVLARLVALEPAPAVLILTAFAAMDTAIEAIRRGAYDYLSKPFRLDDIKRAVRRTLEVQRLARDNQRYRRELRERFDPDRLVGHSPEIVAIYKLVARVAALDTTVLIQGETGTGKELVARAIHYAGPRADRPFVVIDCAAIPEPLFESELFGHERGAFTGAVVTRRGLLETAQGGTCFLDEISELSGALQAKLLREDLPAEVRAETARAPELPPSRMTLEELKRWYVALVLDEAGGNKVRAAELLGIDRRTLYRILEREAGPEE